jgi:hypothetical protein
MEEKYNYLESIAPLLLSHGMCKKGNVIYCELPNHEILLLLNYISNQELSEHSLFEYIESIKNDARYLKKCYKGEKLRAELNEKVGREFFVYDMYRLLYQLDKYLQKNSLGTDMNNILEEYKREELNRNTIVSEINGSYTAVILSRRGIVIQ